MKSEYAQAFLESLNTGMSIDTAITGLEAALKRKKHEKLFAAILLEALRILEAKGTEHAIVRIASATTATTHKTEIEAVLQKLGVTAETSVEEVIDETLIGGFVTTFNHKEIDHSYKKALRSLYESITK